jgi:hypothetical protein
MKWRDVIRSFILQLEEKSLFIFEAFYVSKVIFTLFTLLIQELLDSVRLKIIISSLRLWWFWVFHLQSLSFASWLSS